MLRISGVATSIGEQPLKGLIDPAAMARMSLGEALTNLSFAVVTGLHDIRCSINWMYAAKLGNEGPDMYKAGVALRVGGGGVVRGSTTCYVLLSYSLYAVIAILTIVAILKLEFVLKSGVCCYSYFIGVVVCIVLIGVVN